MSISVSDKPSPRKGWLPREGFTLDVVQSIIQKTVLNPGLLFPLLAYAAYSDKGRGYALDHPTAFKRLKYLLYLGTARWVNGFLNRKALNNWQSDSYDWDKEIVLITGGSDGFGKLLVHHFAEKNPATKIINIDIQEPKYTMPSSNVHYMKVDLSSAEDIAAVARELKEKHGNPTVIINNAGIANPYTILNMPDSVLQKVFAVNTLSHYRVVREFLPAIAAANHGMIVTTASLAAYVTPAGLTEYCASKAAAVSFHEGLSAELPYRYNAPKVRTICICPNFAKTKLANNFLNQSNFTYPTLYPETVAEAIFEKIMSGDSGMVTLPKTASWGAQTIRSWPWWMQKGVATGASYHLSPFADRKEQ